MTGRNAYRDGKVHVCEQLCSTCVFRPGNLTRLHPRGLAAMIAEAKAYESAIICHSTSTGTGPTMPSAVASTTATRPSRCRSPSGSN